MGLGDKHTPEDENFRIISIDGYKCVKIWSSQPEALLNSTHPLEQFIGNNNVLNRQNFSTYNCMKNLDLKTLMVNFIYMDNHFFMMTSGGYISLLDRMKLIWFVCADGCFTHWQAFAKPEPILKSDPIYLEK